MSGRQASLFLKKAENNGNRRLKSQRHASGIAGGGKVKKKIGVVLFPSHKGNRTLVLNFFKKFLFLMLLETRGGF
jgi:hypothetical protein